MDPQWDSVRARFVPKQWPIRHMQRSVASNPEPRPDFVVEFAVIFSSRAQPLNVLRGGIIPGRQQSRSGTQPLYQKHSPFGRADPCPAVVGVQLDRLSASVDNLVSEREPAASRTAQCAGTGSKGLRALDPLTEESWKDHGASSFPKKSAFGSFILQLAPMARLREVFA
jgi:hypothetical protein